MQNRIKEVRESKGLSQAQLGQTLGCKQALISKIEAGWQSITVEQLTLIALSLEVHPAELISTKEWRAPHPAGINGPLLQITLQGLANFIRKYPALDAKDAACIMAYLYRCYALKEPMTKALKRHFESEAESLINGLGSYAETMNNYNNIKRGQFTPSTQTSFKRRSIKKSTAR